MKLLKMKGNSEGRHGENEGRQLGRAKAGKGRAEEEDKEAGSEEVKAREEVVVDQEAEEETGAEEETDEVEEVEVAESNVIFIF